MQKFYLHNGGFIFWFQDEFVYLLMQCLNRRFFGRWLLSRFLCACVCLVLKEAVSWLSLLHKSGVEVTDLPLC